MKLAKQLTMLASIFSLLGCAELRRPDADLKWVNSKKSRLEGYNTKIDYDDNGVRLPGAVLRTWPLTTKIDPDGTMWILGSELDGYLALDSTGQAEIKSFMRRARRAYQRCIEDESK